MTLKSFAFALIGCVAMATAASAATVTYTLDLSVDNQFKVLASASPGDNGGLAGYGLVLTGVPLTLDHNSPKSQAASGAGGFGPAGFTVLRSADGGTAIAGGQDTLTPTPNLIYGLGQQASSFAAKGMTSFDPATEGATWDAMLLLCQGTYDRTLGTIGMNQGAFDTFANVFDDGTGAEVIAADEMFVTIPFGGPGGVAPTANDLSVLDVNTVVTPTVNGTVTASGDTPITFDGLTFVSYTATNGGVDDGNSGAGASLGSGGAFSFPVQGRARGEYLFNFSATNATGTDTGNILVEVQFVPEPSTLALLGLAFVGSLGMIRRRNG